MTDKVILSISLLASNRKATIRKCLDSLKLIMEQVPSELIIVDTGCDEETRAILEEYTDQIVNFEWCDDFSKARNAGLELAKGEWFLYIDDDEWFTDVKEIVDFFLTGEYKKYGVACYIQRNYDNKQGTTYSDSWVSRMAQMTKDTHFESSIHEYITPIVGECKLLHSPADHYGYVFNSEAEKLAHSKRNIVLLVDMLEKEKGRSRWWIQLANEYQGIGEYHKLYDLCKDAVEYFAEADNERINKDRGTFYVGRIRANVRRNYFEEAVEDFKAAIVDKRNTEVCQAALYIEAAAAYLHQKQYPEAADCCRKYLKIYRKLKGDEWALMTQSTFFVRDAFRDESRNSGYAYLIVSELKQGSDLSFKKYFKRFGWEDGVMSLYSGLIPAVIDYMSETAYDEFFDQAAELMMKRKGVRDMVIRELKKKEKELSQEQFLGLARIFSGVDSGHYYVLCLKILYADSEGREEELPALFEALFACVVDIFRLADKYWRIMEEQEMDLHPLFMGIDFDRFKKGVDSFIQNAKKSEIEDRRTLILGLEARGDIRYDYFLTRSAEALCVSSKKSESYEELHGLLLEFVQRSVTFYTGFFKDAAFVGEMEMLPLSCRLAVKLLDALEAEQNGDHRSALGGYKECMNVFPPMNETLKQYSHLYGERIKEVYMAVPAE